MADFTSKRISASVYRITERPEQSSSPLMYLILRNSLAVLINTGRGRGDLMKFLQDEFNLEVCFERKILVICTSSVSDHVGSNHQFSSSAGINDVCQDLCLSNKDPRYSMDSIKCRNTLPQAFTPCQPVQSTTSFAASATTSVQNGPLSSFSSDPQLHTGHIGQTPELTNFKHGIHLEKQPENATTLPKPYKVTRWLGDGERIDISTDHEDYLITIQVPGPCPDTLAIWYPRDKKLFVGNFVYSTTISTAVSESNHSLFGTIAQYAASLGRRSSATLAIGEPLVIGDQFGASLQDYQNSCERLLQFCYEQANPRGIRVCCGKSDDNLQLDALTYLNQVLLQINSGAGSKTWPAFLWSHHELESKLVTSQTIITSNSRVLGSMSPPHITGTSNGHPPNMENPKLNSRQIFSIRRARSVSPTSNITANDLFYPHDNVARKIVVYYRRGLSYDWVTKTLVRLCQWVVNLRSRR